jgi:ankyrin repeat protein
MQDPASTILTAMYHNRRDEAVRLADAAPDLTIWEASALGRDEIVARLVTSDPALANAAAPDGHYPLGLAAFFGHPSTIRILLRQGADVHAAAQNPMKVQPLHAAIASRNSDAVAAVLEAGPDVNARQQMGYTPLMGAGASGKADLVELLLARGADPSLTSDDGKTAAAVAREHGHVRLAEKLEVLAAADGRPGPGR